MKQVREKLLEEVRKNLSRKITDKIFVNGKVTIRKKDFENKVRKKLLSELAAEGDGLVQLTFDYGVPILDDWWAALHKQLSENRFQSKNYDVVFNSKKSDDKYIISYAGTTAGSGTAVQANVIAAIKTRVRNAAKGVSGVISKRIINEHVAAQGAGEVSFPTDSGMSQAEIEAAIRTGDKTPANTAADKAVRKGAKGAQGTKVEQRIRKAIMDTFTDKSFVYHQELELVHDWVDSYFGYDGDLKVALTEYDLNGHLIVQHTLKPEDGLNKGVLDAAIQRRFEKALNKWGIANMYWKLIKGGKLVNILKFFQNSPKLDDKVKAIAKKVVIANLFPDHVTNPNMRLKVNKDLYKNAKDFKSSGKTNKKGSGKKTLTKIVGTTIAASRAASRRKKPRATPSAGRGRGMTQPSPIVLRNLLNEALPQTVAKRMTSPALQFRTGRFANSARVENLDIGPRGGVGIDYTYMRDPYETFEPGNKQGSTQRDPRKIIGASIRELATGLLGKQPSTIRRI